MNKKKNNNPDIRVKFLNGLDELNLQETETLLTGIDKVTLSLDVERSLKARILEKVGAEELGAEELGAEEFGAEEFGAACDAERKTECGKRAAFIKNRTYMRRAVACIAAVMICSIAAVAAANMDGLQRFWGNDSEIYRARSLETAQSVQNKNIKVNIEGIVSDHYQCVFVLSVEALTAEGREIIKKKTGKHYVLEVDIKPAVKAGASYQGTKGIFSYPDDNRNKDYKAYQCDFELENVDLSQPVIVEFAGLSMRFEIPQYMQIISLYPDGDTGIESVELSPIGYYYKASGFAEKVRLINKDGTLDEELGYSGSMTKDISGEITIIGSFTRLIDLNDYLGIQIDGINYMPSSK